MQQKTKWILLTSVLLTILALTIRVKLASIQGIWWDEWSSISYSRNSFAQLMEFLSEHESHPPLFFVLQKLSISLFGETILAIRFMPVISGILTVPAIMYLAYKLDMKFAGMLLAGFLTAIHPFLVHSSVDARMYSLFILLVVLSSLCFLGAIDRRASFFSSSSKTRRSIPYVIFTFLMMNTHYYGALIMAAHLAWSAVLLIMKKVNRSDFFLIVKSHFIVTVAFIPWIIYSNILPWHEDFSSCITTWLTQTPFSEFLISIWNTNVALMAPGNSISAFSSGLMLIFMISSFFVGKSRKVIFLWLMFLTGNFGLYLASLLAEACLGSAIFQIHQTVESVPFLILIVCCGMTLLLEKIHSKVYKLIFVSIIISMFSYQSFVGLSGTLRIKFAELEDIVFKNNGNRDLVLVSPEGAVPMLKHFTAMDVEPITSITFKDRKSVEQDLMLRLEDNDRVWLLLREMPYEEHKMPENHHMALEFLMRHWNVEKKYEFDGPIIWRIFLLNHNIQEML